MRILMSDYDPFKAINFVPIEDRRARGEVARSDKSCIIVTTSGMIVGGPILFYLSKLGSSPQNKLLQIGYQASGTLGREIQNGAKEVLIDGKKVKIALTVESYHLSGHGDRPQLDMLIKKIHGLKRVFLMHGEKEKIMEFKDDLSGKFDAVVPKQGEQYEL